MMSSSEKCPAWVENANDCLFKALETSKDAADLARQISSLVGIPVAVFYLDKLPFANKGRMGEYFSGWRLKLRGMFLSAAAGSHYDDLDFGNMSAKANRMAGYIYDLARRSSPAAARMNARVSGPRQSLIPTRLSGDRDIERAFLLLSSKAYKRDQEISFIIPNLGPKRVERWPRLGFRHYFSLHEIGHILQRDEDNSVEASVMRRWQKELDADRFAFENLWRRAQRAEAEGDPTYASGLREVIDSAIKARHLGVLAAADTHYWTGPILAMEPSSEVASLPTSSAWLSCLVAGTELNMRVACKVNALDLPCESTQMANEIVHWYAKTPGRDPSIKARFDVLKISSWCQDPAIFLPALREMLAEGAFDSVGMEYRLENPVSKETWAGTLVPLAGRMAELAVEAGEYFCPALLQTPGAVVPPKAPPVRRPEPPSSGASPV